MKLYGALLSPFVRKVAVIAAEKGVAWKLSPGGPGSTDPDFLACSPLGKIPAIDDDGFQLADSTAIAVYLDAQYPDNRLIPDDAKLRGKAVFWDEFADTVLGASGLKILFNRIVGPKLLKVGGDEAVALQGESELPRWVDWFETQAPEGGWLLGETFSLADISVASTFRTLAYVGHGIDALARPRTAAWYSRVTARPAWASVAVREEPLTQRILSL